MRGMERSGGEAGRKGRGREGKGREGKGREGKTLTTFATD
jgi:hypothetical protein